VFSFEIIITSVYMIAHVVVTRSGVVIWCCAFLPKRFSVLSSTTAHKHNASDVHHAIITDNLYHKATGLALFKKVY